MGAIEDELSGIGFKNSMPDVLQMPNNGNSQPGSFVSDVEAGDIIEEDR